MQTPRGVRHPYLMTLSGSTCLSVSRVLVGFNICKPIKPTAGLSNFFFASTLYSQLYPGG